MSTRTDAGWSIGALGVRVSGPPSTLVDSLVRRLRAFAASTSADVVFTITEADAPASAVPRPAGLARDLFEPEYAIEYFPTRDMLYLADHSVVARADLATGRVSMAARPGDERGAFLGSHLFFTLPVLEYLKRRGTFAIHAASAALDGRAVLVAGGSGVGKSTIALACALSGWSLLSDDIALVEGDVDRVRGFPDELDLTPDTIALFPEIAGALRGSSSATGKHSVSPIDLSRIHIADAAHLAALVFPERATVGLPRAVDPDEALERLVPNVVRTDVRSAQAHLDALARVARRVPAFSVPIADPLRAPLVLRDVANTPDRG